jgi:AcrR family transcriptional regulator
MRQIAQQAGIALGGLYNHFQGKAEVFEAVFEAYHPYKEILPALLNAEGDTVEELVRNAALRLQEGLVHRPDFLNLMFIEIVEFNSLHISRLFVSIFPEGLKVAQRIAQVGRDRLRPFPIELLMRSFLGLFFSYYVTGVLLKQVWPPVMETKSLDQFVDIYLHGILLEETTAPQ